MRDLGLYISEIWHWLNDAPEPGSPGQINRTVTAWAGRMERAKVMLNEAQRAAIEMQGRLVEQSVQIGRLRETLAAWVSASQTVALNNPYQLTAFTPVSDEDWRRLGELVEREFGHSLDRYSAACMVDAWDACAAAVIQMATEAIG